MEVDQTSKAFLAIKDFVDDLKNIFNDTTVTPLSLYHRLIQKSSPEDKDTVSKVISGFELFFRSYRSLVLDDKLDEIPKDVRISFGSSDRIYLEIQKYLYQKRKDLSTTSAIRDHLLNISFRLSTDKEAQEELKKSQSMPKETKFIRDMVSRVQTQISEDDIDVNNPMGSMLKLFNSGIVQDLCSGMKQASEMEDFDLSKVIDGVKDVFKIKADPVKRTVETTITTTETVKIEELQ